MQNSWVLGARAEPIKAIRQVIQRIDNNRYFCSSQLISHLPALRSTTDNYRKLEVLCELQYLSDFIGPVDMQHDGQFAFAHQRQGLHGNFAVLPFLWFVTVRSKTAQIGECAPQQRNNLSTTTAQIVGSSCVHRPEQCQLWAQQNFITRQYQTCAQSSENIFALGRRSNRVGNTLHYVNGQQGTCRIDRILNIKSGAGCCFATATVYRGFHGTDFF